MKIIIENRTKLPKCTALGLLIYAIEMQDKYEFDELRAHEMAKGIFVSSITNKQSIRYVIWEKQHEKIA